MGNTANAHCQWSLHDNVGRLTYGPLSGEVDIARPYCGLRVPQFDTDRVGCSLLGAHRSAQSLTPDDLKDAETMWWPLPVAESYVRGNDLVATYRSIDSWPYSPQLYWRTETLDAVEGVVASMSLLVSVQTQLLETCPQITLASQAASEEAFRIAVDEKGKAETERVHLASYKLPIGAVCCALRRLVTVPLSYVEIMSSADYFEVRINRAAGKVDVRTEWRLFADFLEKGVIRRARVHGALLSRKNDLEIAVECCKAAEQLELPLTT